MQAIILSIGDELVLGQTLDTNSAHLSARLAERGIWTLYHQTVADDRAAIADAIGHAVGRVELLIVSGGLGPTEDDLTRQALSDALSEPLVLDEPSVAHIRGFFDRIGRTMPQRNTVQAMHPRGTKTIHNACGTAPGIKVRVDGTSLYVVPGVPHEMVAMFDNAIVPDLDAIKGTRHAILTAQVNTFGLGESDVAERLNELMNRDRNPTVGTTVAGTCVAVRIRSVSHAVGEARVELARTVEEVERRLGAVVFGRDDTSLAASLVAQLRQAGRTLATAESCTGGMLGRMITDIAGASAVYRGGWITYNDEMKASQLGVPMDAIREHGAVSHPVARLMAVGALRSSGADLAASVTGVAGPEGGTPDKPVGTVWIALADRDHASDDEIWTDALCFQRGGDRAHVRTRAAHAALQMLRLHATGRPIDLLNSGRRAPMPANLTSGSAGANQPNREIG